MRPAIPLLSMALAACASPLRDTSLCTRQGELDACLDAAELAFVDSESETWDDAIAPWNLRLAAVAPRAVVYATSTEQVQAAVRCAAAAGIKVSAKSGGHSYANFGLGGDDGHLVIQLDRWHDVTLRDDNTAIASAGTRLGLIALELYEQGQRAISHGTCPSVGSGGHVLHGGFGFSSHTHGLALDWMIGANVVLADGSLVHASESEHADLFWALRGAGSSFGVVVEFEFDTFDVSHDVSWFSVPTGKGIETKEDLVDALLSWQKLLEEGGLDSKMNMRFELASRTLEFVYHGDKEDALAAIGPFNDTLGLKWHSNLTISEQGNWIDMLQSWTYGDPMNITYPFEAHDNSYTSSLVTKSIPESAMTSFVDYWVDVALQQDVFPWWLQMDVHGDPNSAIAAVSPEDTGYSHRDKLWLFQFSSPTPPEVDPDAAIEFVNGFMDSLKGEMADGDWGRYANYIDSELSKEVAQQQYWTTNLRRLQRIKARYDPEGVFSNPQSIEA